MRTKRTAFFRVGFALLVALTGVSSNKTTVWGQTTCDEPQDAEYLDSMAAARVALDQGDVETALDHFTWASEQYDYAILDYGVARGLHRLGRYAEAEAAYSRFLRRYEGCPDPDDLRTTAQEYRSLTLHEQASTLETSTEEIDEPDDGEGLNAGWIVISGGVALVSTGLIIDLANLHLKDDAQAADEADNDAEFNRIQDEIDDVRMVEGILFGTGVAAIVVGVVLLLIDGDDEADLEPDVGWVPLRDGAFVTFSMDF